MMTQQVRHVTRKLLAAGFERREFRVRAVRRVRQEGGMRWTEYSGEAVVTVRLHWDQWQGRVNAVLAAGLGVVVYRQHGREYGRVTDELGMVGKLETVDLDELERRRREIVAEITGSDFEEVQ